MLVCANAGDSRAILITERNQGHWVCTPLNRDHKPDDTDEAARIRNMNGRIEPSRLMAGMPGFNPTLIGS
jgi:serine/threonine protein phosphatase PrpC